MNEIELKEGDGCYVVHLPSYDVAAGSIEGPFKLGPPDKRTGNFRVSLKHGVRQFGASGWSRGSHSYTSSTTLYRADDPRLNRIRHGMEYAKQVARLRELVVPRTHRDNRFPRPPELRSVAAATSELAGLCDLIESFQRRLAELQKQQKDDGG